MTFLKHISIFGRLTLLILSSVGLGLFASHVFAAPVQGYVMVVQMTPAICVLDHQKNKKRQCLEGYALNISGLFPETSSRECRTTSSAALSPLQAKVVARVMPDENARVQLWHAIGGCIPMNASQYFRMMINYAERLKIPAELTSTETRVMNFSNLQGRFLRLNPPLLMNSIKFNCSTDRGKPILTEVKLCYASNGQYKKCSIAVEAQCPTSFTIKGSY